MSEKTVIKNYYFRDNSKNFEYVGNYYEAAERSNSTHDDDIEDVDFEVVGECEKQNDGAYTEDNHVLRLGGRVVPLELMGNKAQAVLDKLRSADILDEQYKPNRGLTWWQKGELADLIAAELFIEHKWKVFSQYWELNKGTLRKSFNIAKESPQKDEFDRKIRAILK